MANRLAVIHDLSQPDQWRHVPSKENPADLASRGVRATDEKKLEFWLQGPAFLSQDEEQWPTAAAHADLKHTEPEQEVKKNECASYVVQRQASNVIDKLIDTCSCWFRLRRICAWFLRYKLYCMRTFLKKDVIVSTNRMLSLDEIECAAKSIIQRVQQTQFADEIKLLHAQQPVSTTSKLAPLAPILEGGVLKVGGRLKNSSLPATAMNQMILPQ